MVLFAIIKSARLRSMTNFFLANLAVADFCVGLFCVLPNLYRFLTLTWNLGRVMCKLYYFVWNMCYTASIVILTAIAAERYIAIRYPLRARRFFTLRRLIIAQTMIWTIAGLYNIPYLFVFDIVGGSYCFYDYTIIDMKALTTVNFIVWYAIPLIVMTLIYSKIGTVLWFVGASKKVPALERRTVEQQEDSQSHYTSSSNSSDGIVQRFTFKLHRYTPKTRMLVHCDCASKLSNESCRSCIHNGNVMMKSSSCHRKDSQETCFCIDRNIRNESSSCSGRPEGNSNCASSSSHQCVNIELEYNICGRQSPSGKHFNGFPVRNKRSSRESLSFRPRSHMVTTPTRMNSTRALRNRRKVIRLLVTVVISFAVCVLPHHIRLLLKYWQIRTPGNGSILSLVSFLILYLNSALNPILYALFSANFRKSFKEIVPCKRRFSSKGFHQDTKFGSF
ncbi:trissin receptor-like [Ylistrum balloti]|uniref:trissin receptor-like n=1 Tax=Ylistrum balloti TaxID=509963 RepID=UPI002905F553|nr:trissin receptor-like [Ylistrum balloti]